MRFFFLYVMSQEPELWNIPGISIAHHMFSTWFSKSSCFKMEVNFPMSNFKFAMWKRQFQYKQWKRSYSCNFFLLNGSFVLDHIIAFVTESSTEGEHDPDKNLFMRMYYTHRFSGMQTSFLDDHCVYVLVRTKIVVETSSDRNSMVLKMIKQPSQIVWGILELCTRVISLYSNYMLWLRKTLAVTIGYSILG